MNPRILLIASYVVLAILAMLTVGFCLNAYEQVAMHGAYEMPAAYFDLFWKVLGAAVSCLIVGDRVLRKKESEKEE